MSSGRIGKLSLPNGKSRRPDRVAVMGKGAGGGEEAPLHSHTASSESPLSPRPGRGVGGLAAPRDLCSNVHKGLREGPSGST